MTDIEINALVEKLNGADEDGRLAALKALKEGGGIVRGETHSANVNNHVHTTYSFSPYSPTKAAYMAYVSGLETVGIMDHDSLGGAKEFIKAGEILEIPTTVGVETRVSLKGTPFETRLVNNPDQRGNAYVALHGIPHQNIDKLNKIFGEVREKRNIRNRAMAQKIADFLAPFGIDFDFDKDAMPYALFDKSGTLTERTLCYALALKIIDMNGRGEKTINTVEKLGLSLTQKQRELLADTNNVYYEYDLLGMLKGGLVSKFYIPADEECLTLDQFISLGKEIGAVVAYAYLGDVTQSVTGDKKAQKFEDDFLDELFVMLKEKGVNAIAYMPSRNSGQQLERLRKLCGEFGFFEISGEDINTPRQSFICPQLKNPEFAQLIPATWALIGHEQAASVDVADGMFSDKTVKEMPALQDRIQKFSAYAKKCFNI